MGGIIAIDETLEVSEKKEVLVGLVGYGRYRRDW